eukprot:CAMPEP_0183780812 /NCGR_PEP_ID=MMETSP0739-20130205/57222_1 /TAXON_ID=385413 /ORGANISM="Thalassiosira miniscula, Strain CCMP1093" /LENGTH=164 /DNA_ID=CAMNT_0026023853 /DNA_START=75 /DNA_END=566 /DNA_ORIENTATION=-
MKAALEHSAQGGNHEVKKEKDANDLLSPERGNVKEKNGCSGFEKSLRKELHGGRRNSQVDQSRKCIDGHAAADIPEIKNFIGFRSQPPPISTQGDLDMRMHQSSDKMHQNGDKLRATLGEPMQGNHEIQTVMKSKSDRSQYEEKLNSLENELRVIRHLLEDTKA